MNSKNIDELLQYLMKLAPKFFKEHLVGASLSEIEHLEAVARREFSHDYKAFLRLMGQTPADSLGPFLMGHDFTIGSMHELYEDFPTDPESDSEDTPLPDGLIGFSTLSDHHMFMVEMETPEGSPPLGYYDWANEVLVLDVHESLHSLLFAEAFQFRLNQKAFLMGFHSRYDSKHERWLSRPEKLTEIFGHMGFKTVMEVPTGVLCLDRGDVVAHVHLKDGSGRVSGDDELEVKNIIAPLVEHLGAVPFPDLGRTLAARE